MKKISKIVIAMLAIVMVSIPVFASATTLPTPWSDNTMKVFILDDYNGITPSGSFTPGYVGGGATVTAEYKNDQLWVTSSSTWANDVQFRDSVTWKKQTPLDADANTYPGAAQGVVGYGFYYKNTTEQTIWVKGHWYGSGGFYVSVANAPYYTVNMNGEVAENAFPDNGVVGLGAGAEGYLVVPFASLADSWGNYTPNTIVPSNANYFSLVVGTIDGSNGGALIIDDVFTYGTSDMEGEVIGGNNDGGNEEDTDSADVSVIAYAAAAITGLGALVVAKKR